MKKHRKNDENDKDGIREWIYFCSRWSLAFFTAFAVLTGWVFKAAKTGEYDIFFWLGVVGMITAFGGTVLAASMTVRFIQKLRKPK